MRSVALLGLLLMIAFAPRTASGQTIKAGVVSALEGNVTASRTAVPQPIPLRFRDDVYLQDRITAGDRSLVRLLLGGKAVVTLRERSNVTITELPGRSTITIDSGKIAVVVARERMRAGERIEVRTPNAIAGVRGTVFVAEVTRAAAQSPAAAVPVQTAFFVFRGSVETQVLTPAGTMSAPFVLSPNDMVVLTGTPATPPAVRPMTPAERTQASAGLQPTQPQHTGSLDQSSVRATVSNETTALVSAITGGSGIPGPPTATGNEQVGPATDNRAPINPCEQNPDSCAPPTPCEQDPAGCLAEPGPEPDPVPAVLAPEPEPMPAATEPVPEPSPPPPDPTPLVFVPPGTNVSMPGDFYGFQTPTTLDRPLGVVQDSTLDLGGGLIDIAAQVTSLTPFALMSADPTTITAGGDLFRITSTGSLSLAGELFTDTAGTITAPRLLNVSGGALTVGGSGTLMSFDGSRITLGQGVVTGSSVNFSSGFSDLSMLTLNGSAATAIDNPVLFGGQHVLRLTNYYGQGGSAFLTSPIPLQDEGGFLASFSTAFQFQMTNPQGIGDGDGQGADGLVFVVQTQANNVGGAGGGIGYAGIPKSVGVEFDTYNNGEINGNHVGINVNGSLASLVSRAVGTRLNNGAVWYAWVDYDGETKVFEVRVSETPTRPTEAFLTLSVDLPAVLQQPNAFLGFTSGTGAGVNDHDIRSWQFTNSFDPIASLGDAGVILVTEGGTLTQMGVGPLVDFIGAMLSANGHFLVQTAESVVSLDGSLIRAADSVLELTGGLVRISDGSMLQGPASGQPLVTLTRGSLTAGTETLSGTLFDLRGTATAADGDLHPVTGAPSPLELGTERPLRPGSGAVLEANGTAIDVRGPAGSAFKVDTALLEATAPLIDLKGGASLTTSGSTVDLSLRAKVTSLGDALVKLDASTLTTSSHLVNVAGGSRLSVAGDLVRLANVSTLNVNGGVLLNVSGGSIVSVGGSLVGFSGSNNTVNLTNTLVPTGIVGGLPVFSSLGGTAGFSGTTAVSGLNGNTIRINGAELPPGGAPSIAGISGSVAAIQSGGGSVKIGP
ncbi:MAG: FecR domain-containing protein [Candidatus Rokubacteria bacterium]|nr:FecR domain-containing protein [Candidatus Rokubacteria bacterium]